MRKNKKMEKGELVSVIVPVYNIERYLPRCLETIATQTYQNIEIILVDDGSLDSSGTICDNFAKSDTRASVIHQPNQGLWAARNSGQKVAKGDFLMFVDGDDYLHVDAIWTMHEAINQNGGYDLAMCDRMFTERLNEDNHVEGKNWLTELTQEDLISNMFKHEDSVLFVYQWNKLYRKELIEDLWSREFLRSQDFDYNLRVYLNTKRAVWIHRELYFYVQRKGSLVHSHNAVNLQYINRTTLLFDNYNSLLYNQRHYSQFILKKLYRNMAFLKARVWKTDDEHVYFPKCYEYEMATWKAYWGNCHINLIEKIVVTILLHSPRLTRWLMKVTKNY